MIKASKEMGLTSEFVLQFTGNWLIDLGMLGFFNLLEEIYRWDISETQKRIKENENIVYYGLFPFAYICHEIKRKGSRIPKRIIEDFVNEIYKKRFKSKKEIFDFTWENHITKAAEGHWKDYIIKRAIDENKFNPGTPKTLKRSIGEIEDFGKEFIRKNRDEIKEFLGKKGSFQRFKYEDIKRFQDAPIEQFKEYGEEFIKNAKEFKWMVFEVERYLDEKWGDEVIGSKNIPKERAAFYKIPIDNKYYKNFLFFQQYPTYTHERQKEEFYYTIDSKIKEKDILNRIDKTINKFLASYGEAPNIYYTPLKTEHLIDLIPYLFIYFLCFDRAFEYYRNIGYLVFIQTTFL